MARVGVLLALASAVCYGLSDFAGGLLSRRTSFVAVALGGQLGGLLLALVLAPAFPAAHVAAADLAWGALSGLGTGAGMLFLFRGLSRGAMSVVVPVSAVSGVALPVLVGVAFLGDHPPAASWAGIGVAVPALWLVSRTRPAAGAPAAEAGLDGLVAGVGIALQYVALAQASAPAGIWPIVTGRTTATLAILPLLTRPTRRPAAHRPPARAGEGRRGMRRPLARVTEVGRLDARRMPLAAGTGALAACALTCYLAATRRELLVVAVVLSSLYPVIPVLLGIAVLRERLTPGQVAGFAGAAAAVVLLTLG
jgi:drug/metabolite transporter (DMT)-like permease